jgi:hypothetical protein
MTEIRGDAPSGVPTGAAAMWRSGEPSGDRCRCWGADHQGVVVLSGELDPHGWFTATHVDEVSASS